MYTPLNQTKHDANISLPKKSAHLNTIERYYIHDEFTANNHFNDSQNNFPNQF